MLGVCTAAASTPQLHMMQCVHMMLVQSHDALYFHIMLVHSHSDGVSNQWSMLERHVGHTLFSTWTVLAAPTKLCAPDLFQPACMCKCEILSSRYMLEGEVH